MALVKSPDFPRDFLWGAATSAFQVEGAADADGKGPSIWDLFCRIPGRTEAGETGDRTCDHYRRYLEDVDLMGRLNLNAYRLSVSWPRVIPQGRGPVNEKGLAFYDRLVDALLAQGIEPMITLYHWDLPAALQSELGGWLHPDMAHYFAEYAEVVLGRLGDRVKYWLTLNEPWVVVDAGYVHGVHPPGVQDRSLGYQAGHNLLRAHALAADRYRARRREPGGISLALNSTYTYPETESADDRQAAERAMQTFAGWFGDPCWFGDYPALMRERLGPLLPEFTSEESRLLKRSMDFVAINYYFSDRVCHAPGEGDFDLVRRVPTELPCTEMDWPIMPEGFGALLNWLSQRYERLPIYVTENGAAFDDRADESGWVNDQDRIAYLAGHLSALQSAMHDGVDVRGYFAWSLLDNLEWCHGFGKRFGLVRCDPTTLERSIKASGRWYAERIAEFHGACPGTVKEALSP